MKRIIKIGGAPGSGKSHLLQMIVGSVSASGCIVVDGQSTLQGILQLVRSRENVTLLIDECDPELLAELEAITEHSAVWGRIGCVYAVVRDQVEDTRMLDALVLVQDCLVKCLTGGEVSAKLAGKAVEQAAEAIAKAKGGDI